ncbi:MAG: ATP-binding cassette domain-containing protein [Paracoccaceae bacterium]
MSINRLKEFIRMTLVCVCVCVASHRHIGIMEKHMLSLAGLGRTFGSTRAVENVTLDIRSGEFVGVIGRSGAGKSTLLRLINRLIYPTE